MVMDDFACMPDTDQYLQYFYKGKIFNAVQSSDRPLPAGFPWPVSGAEQHPVVFVNVPQGVEEAGNVGLGKSFMNREEGAYFCYE